MSILAAGGITADTTGTEFNQVLLALYALFGGGPVGYSMLNPGFLLLPAGFIANFGNQDVVSGTTAILGTTGYARPSVVGLPALALCTPGGTSTAGVAGASMNVNGIGATISAGTITNPSSNATQAFSWLVVGR